MAVAALPVSRLAAGAQAQAHCWTRERASHCRLLASPTTSSYRSSASGPALKISAPTRRPTRPARAQAAEEDGGRDGSGATEDVEARLGLGRRARKQKAGARGEAPAPAAGSAKEEKKSWEAMTWAEKAWALYIDPEKGVLFWLNRLAYGAIFALVGGWVVFRFIGPALGWYELDQPLLPPDKLLDGGSGAL